MMPASNFNFSDWEQTLSAVHYDLPELNRRAIPRPLDTYRAGQTSWGKDPKRSRAIICARARRRLDTNRTFFLSHVLPLIEAELNPGAWLGLGLEFDRPDFIRRGGFVRYALGERASWVHPELEPDKVKQAEAMGAQLA